eukprot:4200440-Prymnesium_polylepis.4
MGNEVGSNSSGNAQTPAKAGAGSLCAIGHVEFAARSKAARNSERRRNAAAIDAAFAPWKRT